MSTVATFSQNTPHATGAQVLDAAQQARFRAVSAEMAEAQRVAKRDMTRAEALLAPSRARLAEADDAIVCLLRDLGVDEHRSWTLHDDGTLVPVEPAK